jgi:hypothetical protein
VAVVILHVHKYEKNVTRKFKSGGLHEGHAVVGIANRIRAGRTGVLIPVGGSFLIYRHVQTSSGVYTPPTAIGTGCSFLGAQQPQRDVNQSHRERVRTPLKIFKEKQRASYATWPLAASAVNKSNH